MENERILQTVRAMAASACETRGVEFVHVESAGTKRNMVLRVFIDKPGGITLDDCGNVSRDIEAALDVADLIPGSYVLEVSSPGLERELYSLDDFKRFAGQSIRVKTKDAIDGRKQFKGRLERVDGTIFSIDDRQSGSVTIEYDNVAKANLVFDLADELKRNA